MKAHKISALLIVILITSSFLWYYFKFPKVRAEIALFYPQSCLGSFSNPEKAQGEPEVNSKEEISEYNSAVYYGEFKEIYCGNFQGPTAEGEIQEITLKLNALLTKEQIQKPVIEVEGMGILENILPSKTIEIINTSTEETPENSTSTNFYFLKFVLAEENKEIITSAETTESNETTSTEINLSTLETTTNEENITDIEITTSTETTLEITTSTETNIISEISTSTPPQSLFDIYYTLDGSNWHYLGSIYENTSDFSFEIPVKNWVDISKIQIKINSLPETNYYFYLESMSLEIEYLVSSKEDLEEEDTLTFEETTSLEPIISTQTSILPKIRKIEKMVQIQNFDDISCNFEPFSIEINEGESKSIQLSLNSQSFKKIEIGSLPEGIDLSLENGVYELETENNILNLNLYRYPNSQKGNFSLPIIFSSQNSTIICQINVQAF